MNDLDHVALREGRGHVLCAWNHGLVAFHGDGPRGEAEQLDETTHRDAVRDVVELAVDSNLHRHSGESIAEPARGGERPALLPAPGALERNRGSERREARYRSVHRRARARRAPVRS